MTMLKKKIHTLKSHTNRHSIRGRSWVGGNSSTSSDLIPWISSWYTGTDDSASSSNTSISGGMRRRLKNTNNRIKSRSFKKTLKKHKV